MAECGGNMARNSPVVFNKYALEREESYRASRSRDDRYRRSTRTRAATVPKEDPVNLYRQSGSGRRENVKDDLSISGSKRLLAPTGMAILPPQNDHISKYRRERSTSSVGRKDNIGPSPRIMSPLGFAVHRQTFPRNNRDYYLNDFYDYYLDYNDSYRQDYTRPVPIWLCVFLVISYIIGGAVLFNAQEKEWGLFNSAYFCFITLTTIGFGDYVPHANMEDNPNFSLSTAICSLYLLFGIALLAMSFNLVQEEVINNVKAVARHLGIIKDEDEDE